MQALYTALCRDHKGLFLIIVGQPDLHLSDWRGPNYRYCILKTGKRGHRFRDTEDNRRYLRALQKAIMYEKLRKLVRFNSGTFLTEKLFEILE